MSRDKKGGSVAIYFKRVKSDKRKRGQLIGSVFVFILAFSFGGGFSVSNQTGLYGFVGQGAAIPGQWLG